jgi:hydrogenase expression/formation protein HypE
MRSLIDGFFLPAFAPPAGTSPGRTPPHDSAVLETGGLRLAFTTDTFVVSPLFFPGGDIGKLAICGTVNDLAMSGAKPHWLSAAFVLEEGFPLEQLRRIVESMRRTADEAGVRIVTGDTKVVDRGKGDGVFINTAGVGIVPKELNVNPSQVAAGDAILVSGDLGRHGIAIMSVREGLQFEGALESDCAPLGDLVESLAPLGADLHCLRDLTRGGLAAALNEIAGDVRVGIRLEENSIPVGGPVAGACEMLGLDPLYVANEGRIVVFVPQARADEALAILRRHRYGSQASLIGQVVAEHPGVVELRSPLGGGRIVDLLSGEQMPRIC